MGKQDSHIIHRIRFELSSSDAELAKQASDALGGVAITRVMDQVLKEFENQPQRVRIDLIELDAGHLLPEDLQDLENILLERLAGPLRKEVLSQRKSGTVTKGAGRKDPAEMDADESQWTALFHYFQTGQKAWFLAEEVDVRLVWNQWITSFGKELPNKIKEAASLNPAALYRMAQLFSESQFQTVLLPALPQALKKNLLVLQAWFPKEHPFVPEIFSSETMLGFLTILLESLERESTQSYIMMALLQNWNSRIKKEDRGEWILELQQKMQKNKEESSGMSPEARRILKQFVMEVLPQTDFQTKAGEARNQKKGNTSPDNVEKEAVAKNNVFSDSEKKVGEMDPAIRKDLLITHAGLVLVNAGLMMSYFKRIGWVQENKIADTDAGVSIRLWMHYLVWGDQPALDYDLILPKIMTGFPVQQPGSFFPELSKNHRKAGDDFLKEEIGYWKQLKNTSPDGLRTAFLQRNGILTMEPVGWQLQVEGKTPDILIDRLPWSYSIIKLPWMEKPLFTQWNTSN